MTAEGCHRVRVAVAFLAAAGLMLIAQSAAAADRGDPSLADEMVSLSAVGEVRFPHSLHAEELGFDCSDCHHETNAPRLRMPHDEYFEDFWIDCRTCHRETDSVAVPQNCADCHHASPVSTADETLSAKVVVHRKCWECHDSGTGEEASQSCGFCHTGRRLPVEESR